MAIETKDCLTFLLHYDRRSHSSIAGLPGWDFVWKHFDSAVAELRHFGDAAAFVPEPLPFPRRGDSVLLYIQEFSKWGAREVLAMGECLEMTTDPRLFQCWQSLQTMLQALTVLERSELAKTEAIRTTWIGFDCPCGVEHITGEALLPQTDFERDERWKRTMVESAALEQQCPHYAARMAERRAARGSETSGG